MGLSNEFYKKFNDYGALYIQTFKEWTLPQTLAESTITLIPKKDKNLEEHGSYRAIVLLNTDQKIIVKTLACRSSLLISKLIHPDQTGFIPNRHSFYNLRRLFNIIPA